MSGGNYITRLVAAPPQTEAEPQMCVSASAGKPEGESNASSASTVTQVGDSSVALYARPRTALREEERDKVFEAILSRIGGDRPGEIPVPSPSSTSISHGGSLKVPPFRKLEPEEDVDSYFGAFEASSMMCPMVNGVSIWDPSLTQMQIWCIWLWIRQQGSNTLR